MRPLVAFALLALTALCAAPLATPAARAADLRAATADLCRLQTERQGRAAGIPDNLLRAISHVESGRWSEARKAKVAWPWTVMAEGRGRYFPTKAAAIAEVRKLQAGGVHNIDVGCMQINLHYHGGAFDSLEDAFDPAANVAYAVEFLSSLKAETGTWSKAAMLYHSRTPEHARRYHLKVVQAWNALNAASPASPGRAAAPANLQADYSDAQLAALLKRKRQIRAARAEARQDRLEARQFAENWRAKRMREYLESKQAATGGAL